MRRGCVNSLPSFFLGFGTAVGSGIIGESFGPESTEKTTQQYDKPYVLHDVIAKNDVTSHTNLHQARFAVVMP